ncbi:hypothetical protein PIB30_037185 [Stylosanthes scabra]|uniref:Uncharacterized protein n=1 Tax=Stylosanthes scabra TaxID=79078 RepID=A0ABU6VCZ8_9FABA|nr:hypothetical protein [Stylosanthes scabra]
MLPSRVRKNLEDSYQWEPIHEWVVLKMVEVNFDVFLKEFGKEIFSVQSYPSIVHEESMYSSDETHMGKEARDSDGQTVASELEAEGDQSRMEDREVQEAGREKGITIVKDLRDPLIEVINVKRSEAEGINASRVCRAVEVFFIEVNQIINKKKGNDGITYEERVENGEGEHMKADGIILSEAHLGI